MTKAKSDNLMVKLSTYVSYHHEKVLKLISQKRQIPVSRLISFAIDNELGEEDAFDIGAEIPTYDYEEFEYAKEAGMIMTYIRRLKKPNGLDILLVLRHDIGIPDKHIFLSAFRECLDKNLIEEVDRPSVGIKADDYKFYQATGAMTFKKTNRQSKGYDLYLKLKKKYENEDQNATTETE